jgi:hypothetical protein
MSRPASKSMTPRRTAKDATVTLSMSGKMLMARPAFMGRNSHAPR